MKKRICILGGGFGGLYTALGLRKLSKKNSDYEIILIDQNDHLLFTPLLYELITEEMKDWEIAPPLKQLLANTKIKIYQDKITQIDLKKRELETETQEKINYECLILTVGREVRLNGLPGVKEYTHPFRTLEDVYKLKHKINQLLNSNLDKIKVAIAGGGPSGVELAGKIADKLGKRGDVHLITRDNRILRHFTPATRQSAINALNKRGVAISLDTSIIEIAANYITFQQNQEIGKLPTDLVIWTTGTQARKLITDLAPSNQINQLIATATLQLPEYPEVFTLGDVAQVIDGNDQIVPATAQATYQQANLAAKNIQRFLAGKKTKKFRYLHLGEMIALGKNDSAITSFGLHLHGRLANLIRRLVYLERMPTLSHRWRVLSFWLQQFFNIIGR
jgi:NADH dehydrogenase